MQHAHIAKSFDDELENLQNKILLMGEHARAQLDAAENALIERDNTVVEKIVKNDALIDELAHGVDKLAVRLLALRQPMGMDLRSIISGLKIAGELERIADYAVNIARNIEKVNATALTDPIDSIVSMAETAKTMLEDAIHAYSKSDVKLAVDAWNRDDRIDEVYTQLLVQLRQSMKEDVRNVDPCTSLILIGRCIERIGDHVTNICEHVYYQVVGEDLSVT